MGPRTYAAVDLSASGGRVMAGVVDQTGSVELRAVHRFPNRIVESDGHLRWDFSGLFGAVMTGLERMAGEYPDVGSVGVDGWGVDYGLLDAGGRLLAEPISYRDSRTDKAIARVHNRIPADELYSLTGTQFLPFNTIYQLSAEQEDSLLDGAAHALLLPDLLAYWLTGHMATEYTNASTTGMLDLGSRDWSSEICNRLGLPAGLFPPVEQPGAIRGALSPSVSRRTGLATGTTVTTVGSHDTASAVVAVPATARRFAYISCGTWSLVGLEIPEPVVSPAARAANFTNEGGVDGRIRFLRNTGGLWLLEECIKEWGTADRDSLLAEAASLPPGGPTIAVDDPGFIPPGGMPDRIATAAGDPLPSPAHTVRCIIESLADTFARTLHEAATLAGTDIDVVHIVGGGSQNGLLCQLTADAAGVPVVAGPVEATALGNVIVQARTDGRLAASLEAVRAALAGSVPLSRYVPR